VAGKRTEEPREGEKGLNCGGYMGSREKKKKCHGGLGGGGGGGGGVWGGVVGGGGVGLGGGGGGCWRGKGGRVCFSGLQKGGVSSKGTVFYTNHQSGGEKEPNIEGKRNAVRRTNKIRGGRQV